MSLNTTAYFTSTSNGISDVMFSPAYTPTSLELYDFSAFVETFVLSEKVLLSATTYEKLNILNQYTEEDQVLIKVCDLTIEKLCASLQTAIQPCMEMLEARQPHNNYNGTVEKEPLAEAQDRLILDALAAASRFIGLQAIMCEPEMFTKVMAQSERDINSVLLDLNTFLMQNGISFSPGIGFVDYIEDVNPNERRQLYLEVAKQLNLDIAKINKHTCLHSVYLPPFTSMLLDRCKERASLAFELVKLRREFSELRSNITSYEHRISEAASIKDKLDVLTELEETQRVLVRKLTKDPHTGFVRRAWDIAKGVSPSKIATNIGDALLDYDTNRKALNRSVRYVNLYNDVIAINNYGRLVQKIFGDESLNKVELQSIAAKLNKHVV